LLYLDDPNFEREAGKLEAQMRDWAGKLEFEKAAAIRDRVQSVRRERLTSI